MRMFERLGFAVAALSLVAIATAAPASANSSAGCSGFNGRWQTTWGASASSTRMRISGTEGVYDYQDGTISGEIDGNVFSGRYHQSDGGSGRFKFWLADDGNSFSGWFAPSAHPADHQTWKGACLGP
jgi:hypothetical protein